MKKIFQIKNELLKSEKRINDIGLTLEEVKVFYSEEINLEELITKQKEIVNTLSISERDIEIKKKK